MDETVRKRQCGETSAKAALITLLRWVRRSHAEIRHIGIRIKDK